ncbi:hypothetical protein [Desulforamulus hydrothermalis]|uniref:Lipoprotein n=1 Tax=Desulforamulus hydrothermalis Lam5 = DSM 18033 TaxID=1121428 RepID=K8DZ42_9FIRM|nr:hypothetical protein [Desulforamulus hydrothermalis]CCO08160.1 conserved exported hypothetical protein [Desulforamulus hydrothermalis Lam5 = DSM 18033]SHH23490.1 hypothetical protein SAMN02745177_01921 [Desulforamulus hydrothermalis Lam5 = DSM 18033]
MYKHLKLVWLLIFISVVAVGCTNIKENAAVEEVKNEAITIPTERPSVIGKVKEVVGNEVTLYVAQAPQNEAAPTANQADQERKPSPQQGPELKFSSETKTFLLPVGVPVVTMQGGTAKQVELSKITKDAVLRIWQKDDTITFVQMVNGNRARSNEQNQPNNRRTGDGPPAGGPPPGM